ncbi:unnamed protein product [Cunninghamella blakesleeana]
MFSFGNPSTATTTTPASSFSFGHQRNNTTGGLFSTPAAGTATNTAAPTFGGGASTSTAAPTFGTTPVSTTAPTFGAAPTNTTAPTFGTGSTNTAAPTFGGNTTSTLPSLNTSTSFSFSNNNNQTKPLFGSTFNTTNTASSFSLNTNQQQQQQQQQPNSLLNLHSVFPDTNVPYFIIKPDSVDRVSVPPSFFLTSRSTGGGNLDPTSIKNKDISSFLNNSNINNNNNNNASSSSISNTSSSYHIGMKRSLSFASHSREKRKVLPGFLTSSPGDVISTGQKKTTDDDKDKRVLFKSSSTPSSTYGIFGDDQPDKPKTFGKQQNTGKVSIDDPPVLSMWDVGVNPKPPIFSVIDSDLKQSDKSISSINDKSFGILSKGSTTVSIFGFPPEMSDAIFEHFVKCGDVAERGVTGVNWMNIKYTTTEGAQNALLYNGRMLFNNYIIGVTLVAPEATTTNKDTSIKQIKLESSKDSIFKNNTNNPSGTLDYIPNLFYSAISSSGSILSSSSSSSNNNNNNNSLSEKRVTKISDGGIIEKFKDAIFGW